MMPGLLTGDRLVVTKYPYGWSWVSPSFHVFPPMQGRLFGRMPQRGDIVIVTPPGTRTDYIKRVIGLPGDTLRMVDGTLIINGQPVKRETRAPKMIPVDANSPCGSEHDPALYDFRVRGPDGKTYCRVPIVRETLPNGRSYDTVELGRSTEDNFGPVRVPANHLWLMGDNRDDSADSRVPESLGGLGGAVPWENIGGRAEFITFSLDGSTVWYNPLTWFDAFRPGRAGTSLRSS
jgi:signal peptidase I